MLTDSKTFQISHFWLDHCLASSRRWAAYFIGCTKPLLSDDSWTLSMTWRRRWLRYLEREEWSSRKEEDSIKAEFTGRQTLCMKQWLCSGALRMASRPWQTEHLVRQQHSSTLWQKNQLQLYRTNCERDNECKTRPGNDLIKTGPRPCQTRHDERRERHLLTVAWNSSAAVTLRLMLRAVSFRTVWYEWEDLDKCR